MNPSCLLGELERRRLGGSGLGPPSRFTSWLEAPEVQDGLNLVRASKEGEVEIDCLGHRDLRNEDLILKEAEEQVGICDIIPHLFKFLKRRRKRRNRVWHVYTALFKVDNQQRPPVVHRELCFVFCDSLNGQRIWRIDTCVYIMWNWHNIVNKLCPNIKYKVKKKIFIRQLKQSTVKSVPDDPWQGHLHLIYWINICWLSDFFFLK